MKFLLLLPAILIFMVPATLHAQQDVPVDLFRICDKEDAKGSTVCKENEAQRTAIKNDKGNNPIFGPNGIITSLINVFSAIAGIAAVIMIIIAGLRFITGGNNPQDIASARNLIIFAVVGLVIVASSQLLVQVFISKL